MPRGRKRRQQEGEGPDDPNTKEIIRTAQISLSSVLARNQGTANFLPPLLLFVNQIRVIGSLIAKHHLLACLSISEDLSYTPDQAYFAACFTLAQGKPLRNDAPHLQSLTASANAILALFPAPVYNAPDDADPEARKVSATGVNQILCWFAKQLGENTSTHLKTHSADVLKVWMNNHIRALVMDENPGLEGQALQKVLKERRIAIKSDESSPLRLAHDLIEQELSDMLEAPSAERTRRLLSAYYALQLNTGSLVDNHGDSFKLYSIVPEASVGIAPITICRRVMLHLFNAIHFQPRTKKDGSRSKRKAPKMIRNDEMDETNWEALFNMNKIRALRSAPWAFAHTVMTDGVRLYVRFCKRVPKVNYLDPDDYLARSVDMNVPGLYSDQNTFDPHQLDSANYVAVDPGVHRVLTAARLADVDRRTLTLKTGSKPLLVSQRQYSEEAMLRYRQKKSGTLHCNVNKKRGRNKGRQKRWIRRKKKERRRKSFALKVPLASATAALQAAPSPKRVEVHKYNNYLRALASVWQSLWAYHGAVKRRKIDFFVHRRRESFMARVVNSFEERFGSGVVILFGNGADNGLFGRLKGGGVKGPVKELKRRLAERYCVIGCSEFRSSKLCIHCGRELHFHKHGVAYCAQQSHHAMLNRDVTAAIKIGAIFLAKKKGMPLGPWAWGAPINNADTSRALASAITGHAAREDALLHHGVEDC